MNNELPSLAHCLWSHWFSRMLEVMPQAFASPADPEARRLYDAFKARKEELHHAHDPNQSLWYCRPDPAIVPIDHRRPVYKVTQLTFGLSWRKL